MTSARADDRAVLITRPVAAPSDCVVRTWVGDAIEGIPVMPRLRAAPAR